MFRVPLLLDKSVAVIYRLDPSAIKESTPILDSTSGYDDDLHEPLVYNEQDPFDNTVRLTSRIELPPVRVPCQVEVDRYATLDQLYSGASLHTNMQLVFHIADLQNLNLITSTGELLININDRLAQLEDLITNKIIAQLPSPGLFIRQIQPASWGFGYGFDLYIIYLADRVLQ